MSSTMTLLGAAKEEGGRGGTPTRTLKKEGEKTEKAPEKTAKEKSQLDKTLADGNKVKASFNNARVALSSVLNAMETQRSWKWSSNDGSRRLVSDTLNAMTSTLSTFAHNYIVMDIKDIKKEIPDPSKLIAAVMNMIPELAKSAETANTLAKKMVERHRLEIQYELPQSPAAKS